MTNIKDQIQKLVILQQTDKQIYNYSQKLREYPALLDSIKKELEEKKRSLQLAEDSFKKTQLKQKEKEGELSTKEAEINKQQSQLFQLKTNKEYNAKLSEIAGIKADKSKLEEDILMIFDEVDAARKNLENEKKVFQEEEVRSNQEKKKIEEDIKILENKIKDLEGKRKQEADQVDIKILTNYEKILKNKEGLAIVPVRNFACQGCFMNVTPQTVNEINMHEKLVTCEMCARILYVEEGQTH
ncbi:MAG: C4-type zinc ribbon domain-containing protein [Candidatus Omnitrophota bacterium]